MLIVKSEKHIQTYYTLTSVYNSIQYNSASFQNYTYGLKNKNKCFSLNIIRENEVIILKKETYGKAAILHCYLITF